MDANRRPQDKLVPVLLSASRSSGTSWTPLSAEEEEEEEEDEEKEGVPFLSFPPYTPLFL